MTREEAIYEIKQLAVLSNDKEIPKITEALEMAIEALSADVVRCKDCIHYESDGGAMMVCSVTDMVCDNDDYCSYGERKGGEDNNA